MNLIQKELEQAKSEMFDLISGANEKLVELSRGNVAKVEAVIQNDSAYIRSSDKTYRGSTAYWMMQLKGALWGGKSHDGDYYDVFSQAVLAVDRDNSTHLNADGVGREEMTHRLCDISKERLIEFLKKPKETAYHLIEVLSSPTHPKDANHKPRSNLSFASKFCHYACFYVFEGEAEQDNYSIYDNVVRKVLPRYCEYYHIAKLGHRDNDYAKYQGTIDAIIKAAGGHISRNGFDHLLWYYFKGRI